MSQGNTFPATVFSLYGGFWFTFGATLVPGYGAYAAYSPDPNSPAEGLTEPAFYATFAFFLVTLVLLSSFFCVASIRTNVAFFLIFLLVIPACKFQFFFCIPPIILCMTHEHRITEYRLLTYSNSVSCLAAAFFALANGNSASATNLQHVGAGLLLALSLLGWYIFFALVLLSVDFPYKLPLGDLSTGIRGASDREKAKRDAGKV
jgi:uncharacterized protein